LYLFLGCLLGMSEDLQPSAGYEVHTAFLGEGRNPNGTMRRERVEDERRESLPSLPPDPTRSPQGLQSAEYDPSTASHPVHVKFNTVSRNWY